MNKLALILSTAFIIFGCKNKTLEKGTNFREAMFTYNDYASESDTNQWITNSVEAGKSIKEIDGKLLTQAIPDIDSYYNNKVQYIFTFGGGCYNGEIDELSTVFKDSVLYIIWDAPKSPCPKVGERSSRQAILEIDKSLYPNYRKLKVELTNR